MQLLLNFSAGAATAAFKQCHKVTATINHICYTSGNEMESEAEDELCSSASYSETKYSFTVVNQIVAKIQLAKAIKSCNPLIDTLSPIFVTLTIYRTAARN